jgi:hypothetical protein
MMLDRVIKVKAAYDAMCNGGDDVLNEYRMTPGEWDYIERLKGLLHCFEHLTSKISGSTYPTISKTIAVYNTLMDHIEDFLSNNKRIIKSLKRCNKDKNNNNNDNDNDTNTDTDNSDTDNDTDIDNNNSSNNNNDCLQRQRLRLLQQLGMGATAAMDKLKQYYTRSDMTYVYSVATAMDCRMKFYWWDRKGWEPEYQDMAQDMVKDIWKIKYEVEKASTITTTTDLDDDDFCVNYENYDELQRYVTEPATDSAPLNFWSRHHTTWPSLSKMAQHFLAVPATSTPSERCFSQARLLLPYTRNRLTKENIEKLMLLENWMKKLK